MATLSVQQIVRTGLSPSLVAADSEGDEFANTGREFVHVKNGDASPHTVTIVTPVTVDDLAVADRDVVVPAGEERMIGPLPTATYNTAGGVVQMTYDAVASVTIGVFKP